MANELSASLPNGISITKTRRLPVGQGDATFSVVAEPGSDVGIALLADAPFPSRKIDLSEMSVTASAGRDLVLDAGRGRVSFGGKANAYRRLGVLDDPLEVTAALVRDGVNDDLARGLSLPAGTDARYLLLRWGYDLEGCTKGAIALGTGPKVTFGAEGRRLGAYAIVRQFAKGPDAPGAASQLRALFDSWMLPSHYHGLDDLEPGTWIVAEVDGSVALSLGAEYGIDFSWIREVVTPGGASGDIGLKIQVGVSAAVGFEASGQYALALGRPLGSQQVRMQLFRLDRKGLSLAFSAGASVQGTLGGEFAGSFDDFVAAVFGLHGMQVLKDLETWTSPDQPLSALVAGAADGYARDFLTEVTGIDAESAFNEARGRLVRLLTAWHELPHATASFLYSFVARQATLVPELRQDLAVLASRDLTEFRPDLARVLSRVDFFRSPLGKWLESAALTSVLAAASEPREYAMVQRIARQTLDILDGGLMERTLLSLQREIGQRIGLNRVEEIVDQASFDRADEWLKARLAAFLGRSIDVQQVEQIRTAVHRLVQLRETFFEKARTALTRKYEFQLIASYEKATTSTALIDVVFDYGLPGASAATLTRLAEAAIDGRFEQLITADLPGVTLHQAVLTHGVKRQSHVELSMPFRHSEMTHINSSLAKVESIQSERGRVLVYDLSADDLLTARNRFSSRFTIHGQFAKSLAVRVFDGQALTHAYSFRQAVPKMRRVALEAQLRAYVDTYFPEMFGTGEASLSTWISDLDRTIDKLLNNGPDNFGTTLLSLELSAPSSLVGAWALAPQDAKAESYFVMSKHIQRQMRRLIPLVHFADLHKYADRIPSAALLVYSSLPAASEIVVRDGHVMQFDDKSDVFWDFESPVKVDAMVQHATTTAALLGRLAAAHDTLAHAEGNVAHLAGDYRPERLERIVVDATVAGVGRQDLLALLRAESTVIREARRAGLAIAGFLAAADTTSARRELAEYGSSVTNAFNTNIGGLFSGNLLRPLGTMVFLEAARAFAPAAATGRPGAILELSVVRDDPSCDLGSFIEGNAVPEAALVIPPQRFVALV